MSNYIIYSFSLIFPSQRLGGVVSLHPDQVARFNGFLGKTLNSLSASLHASTNGYLSPYVLWRATGLYKKCYINIEIASKVSKTQAFFGTTPTQYRANYANHRSTSQRQLDYGFNIPIEGDFIQSLLFTDTMNKIWLFIIIWGKDKKEHSIS